jgi:hypothetical protein
VFHPNERNRLVAKICIIETNYKLNCKIKILQYLFINYFQRQHTLKKRFITKLVKFHAFLPNDFKFSASNQNLDKNYRVTRIETRKTSSCTLLDIQIWYFFGCCPWIVFLDDEIIALPSIKQKSRLLLFRDVLIENKELILGPGITLIPQLFSLPFLIISIAFACQDIETSSIRYLLIISYLTIFIPLLTTFFLYISLSLSLHFIPENGVLLN